MIDKATGISFCGGDEEFYYDIVSEYLADSEDKLPAIERSFKDGNWKEYEINIHALKSTSKMIGALELSEAAARLETGVKEGDIGIVENGQEKLMEMYREVLKYLREGF